ncbi:acyltransferase domain-containing protein [Streptomyces sp. NPDC053560]|uniref:acyltransferase domain-containing protein n=1 Tax=Streptomyces sp. NPDC053560 TaxID=3365711 RepID=UPI0037CEBA3F
MSSPPRATRNERYPQPYDIVHLFPGQGDFALGPLVQAVRAHAPVRAAVADTFGEAAEAGAEFGIPPLAEALLGDSPPSSRDLAEAPVGTPQLALFCSSIAVHRALCAIGLPPRQVAGVSFGEIAALTAAGVFSVPDGARIACLLARRLAECPGGMTLFKTGESHTVALLAGAPDVAVACVNDPEETVVSGPVPALRAVEEIAEGQGVSVVRLRLPFPSHHPSLCDAAEAFLASIRPLPARPARVPVHSAVRGRAYRPGDDVHRGLADCLVRPARLPGLLHELTSSRGALLFEAGTGRALTRSARRVLPDTGGRTYATLWDPGVPWPSPGAADTLPAGPAARSAGVSR